MRLAAATISVPPGVDPAVVAAADAAMTFDFDADKLLVLAAQHRFPARDSVALITASDELATLDDTTFDAARMAFEAARSRSVGDVVDVMDAVNDAVTMDDASLEALGLGFQALRVRSASDVVHAIERVDRANVMDADTLRALRAELG